MSVQCYANNNMPYPDSNLPPLAMYFIGLASSDTNWHGTCLSVDDMSRPYRAAVFGLRAVFFLLVHTASFAAQSPYAIRPCRSGVGRLLPITNLASGSLFCALERQLCTVVRHSYQYMNSGSRSRDPPTACFSVFIVLKAEVGAHYCPEE